MTNSRSLSTRWALLAPLLLAVLAGGLWMSWRVGTARRAAAPSEVETAPDEAPQPDESSGPRVAPVDDSAADQPRTAGEGAPSLAEGDGTAATDAAVHGTIVDEQGAPAGGVIVLIRRLHDGAVRDGDLTTRVIADAEGRFVASLPDGDYFFTALPDGTAFAAFDGSSARCELPYAREITLTVQRLGWVRVRVQPRNGSGTVVLPAPWAETADGWRRRVPQGIQRVEVVAPGFAASYVIREVRADREADLGTVFLREVRRWRGTVTDARGRPLRGVFVRPRGGTPALARTRADGSFDVSLAEGAPVDFFTYDLASRTVRVGAENPSEVRLVRGMRVVVRRARGYGSETVTRLDGGDPEDEPRWVSFDVNGVGVIHLAPGRWRIGKAEITAVEGGDATLDL